MITVMATREGLVGGKTSTGYKVDTVVPFVALPSVAALRQWVRVRNPANGTTTRALVLDVGPWNENDNSYVFGGQRPQAESGWDKSHPPRKTNKAGIDLGEQVWNSLGMKDNGMVEWEFI